MGNFAITPDVLRNIIGTATRHFRSLNDELTHAYPDKSNAASVVAVGAHIAIQLNSSSNAVAREYVAKGINETLTLAAVPYRLVPKGYEA